MKLMKLIDEHGCDVIINISEVVTIKQRTVNQKSQVDFKMSDGSVAIKKDALLTDVELILKKEIINTNFK